MPRAVLGSLLLYLRQLHDHSTDATDGELLRRYAGGDEAAFAALVRRHAALVWGVCRRVLHNEQDAEDAFQAAFLVLMRKADSLRAPQSLAAFLHGVASRLARKARMTAQRRRCHEARAESPSSGDPFAVVELRELRALLDEELLRLPEKYRAPLALCYLEGLSYTEAARQLGWREGTVCGRLARARELLRQRLSQRGLTLSGAALAATLTEPSSAPAATAVAAVTRMATLFALGQAPGSGAVSLSVASLAQDALQAMTVAKMKTVVALVAVFCALASGGGLAAHRFWTAKESPLERTETPPTGNNAEQPRKEPLAHTDRYGDPLPPEAIARLGTTHFRHGYNVFDIAFSPDGTRGVSADWYGAHLWEAASGRELHRLGPRLQTSLRSLSLSGDGKIVALAEHHHGTIQILDLATGKLLRQFANGPDNDDRFCTVSFSPDSKILASYAGKIIRLWDPATGKQLRQWQADPEGVHRIVFAPDSKTLISGGDDRTIRFWDTATGKEVRRITDHPGPVMGLALSSDGKVLASLGSTRREFNQPGGGISVMWLTDNKVHLWDAAVGKNLRQLEAAGPPPKNPGLSSHPNAISHFLFAPDDKSLVTAGQDRTIRIWGVNEGKELRRWEIPWVTSLVFARDGKTLATGGIDCTVRFWDWTTGRELREQPGHYGGVQFLALSRDGRHVASASIDRTVRIWDTASGRELHRLRGPEGEMAPVAFSADGRTMTTVGVELTVGGADKKGRVWDTATGRELRQIPEWTACSSSTVSDDGRIYAFAVESKQVWLWDAVAERKRSVRIEHPKGIFKLAFSPDARALFGWCGDQKVHVWDPDTGKELRQFAAGEGGDWNFVAFSPDGRWLAWANRDREIRLCNLGTGKEVRRLMGTSPFISCLAFAPDGRTLAGGSLNDPVIYLWETASGQVRHRLTGHEGRIFTLVFSADGKRLLSGSEDTTVLVWDLIGGHVGGRERKTSLSPVGLKTRWDELASTDAETAYSALRSFTAAAGPAVDYMRMQLRPIPVPDPKRVARLIADLDHDAFARREMAAKELEKLGEAIESSLRSALVDAKSVEMRRRLEALLAKLSDLERQTPSAAYLQMLRAVEVLERIGTQEAKDLLEKLAQSAPEARLTREAKASLQRLAHRAVAKP
jgi:RNA polymerase sigma factor (sigma-70 family)